LLRFLALALICVLIALASFAQTEGARISGRVTDLRGAVIVGAQCKITNIETDVSTATSTNEDGIYVIPGLRPATYRLTIEKEGFRTVVQPSLQLYVQDAVNENFTMAIGPASESVTVFADTSGLQTDSAAVSTVIDDQFVQNMPLNGRSFQSLIALAPGTVFVSGIEGAGRSA
jgi:Carboxypeptidase regulatory-like domain